MTDEDCGQLDLIFKVKTYMNDMDGGGDFFFSESLFLALKISLVR